MFSISLAEFAIIPPTVLEFFAPDTPDSPILSSSCSSTSEIKPSESVKPGSQKQLQNLGESWVKDDGVWESTEEDWDITNNSPNIPTEWKYVEDNKESRHDNPRKKEFADSIKIKTCLCGRYFLFANRDSFMLLKREKTQFEVLCKKSKEPEEIDEISAAECIPLYSPSTPNEPRILIAVGYTSGKLILFNEDGDQISTQHLHPSALISITLRGAPNIHSLDTNIASDTDDELILLFADRVIVEINGTSLWLALRMNNGVGSDSTSLTYSKKEFRTQQSISQVVSLGPLFSFGLQPANLGSVVANKLGAAEGSKNVSGLLYNQLYIGVGKNPMISFYSSSTNSRTFSTIVSFATSGLSTVTSAVFSFAKSFWNEPASQTSVAASQNSPTSAISQSPNFAPATQVPSIFSLSDPSSHRNINDVSLSPQDPRTHRSKWAAVTDSLGRVMVIDLTEGEVVRMIKGVRGAQTVFLEKKIKGKREVLLAVYSKRGALEIFGMRYSKRIAQMHVGVGMRMLQCCVEDCGVVGAVYHGESVLGVGCAGGSKVFQKLGNWKKDAIGVILIAANGDVKNIQLNET
ncbi:Rab3 GTPase-activating protein non-catalytic subunit [Nowakowskiella sp. JEL0407]|nr:Rab3 GTPase-activating protein non-catalytic subunit [Nowakowskiella sp. JEL0407]